MSKDTPFKLPSQRQRELLASATSEYTNHLATALPYLTSRGITAEQAQRWQLGFVQNPVSSHERFQGYLAIPYLTPAGPVAIKFRCINCPDGCEGHPKYDKAKGEGFFLFGVQTLVDAGDTVAICEGELDTIVANEAGIPALGVASANVWLSHWDFVFEPFERVIVFLDGDPPKLPRTNAEGERVLIAPSQQLENNVHKHLSNARSVQLPLGEDVNSIVLKEGPQGLRERAGLG